MNGLFWKKSRARKLRRSVSPGPRGISSVILSLVAGGHDSPGVAQKEGRAALEGALPRPPADVRALGEQPRVDGVGRDLAPRDIDDVEARALPEEADGQLLARARAVEMRGDLRAVAERPGRADDGQDGERDPGHVLGELGDLPALPLQLLRVAQVLVLAAAAPAEERAPGLDPVRRGLEHLHEVGLRVVGVVAEDPCADPLARQSERHHDDPLARGLLPRQVDAAQPDAQVGQRRDRQLDLLVVAERPVVEFFPFGHGRHITVK